MTRIRIGAPQDVSVRPLIFGLTRATPSNAELIYDDPARLALYVERGLLDLALVPTIEYLRGCGEELVEGPALVARPTGRTVLLAAQKPLEELERVAVHEYCRSPIVVARAVLDRLHGVTPDLLVEKNFQADWRERYDAILFSGDAALRQVLAGFPPEVTVHDVTAMWHELAAKPLVLGVWVYNNRRLTGTFAKWLVTSRNLGVQNLSRLADGIASTSEFDSTVLYEYLSDAWSYQLGAEELDGIRTLEETALAYDLLRATRAARLTV